jgi:c-di-GMP-binding flagellar brake protein YcgR
MSENSLNLTINQKIHLEVTDPEYAGTYSSRVEDITKNVISVAIPTHHRELVPIRKNTNLRINVTCEDAVYSFKAVVLDRQLSPVPILLLEMPREKRMERIQRRRHVRLPISIQIEYAIFSVKEKKPEYKYAKTSNISAGGLLFILPEPLEVGARLRFRISVSQDIPPVPAKGDIIRVFQDEDKNKTQDPRFYIAVSFCDITIKNQDIITQYIFEQQRSQRRMGLM